MATTDDDGTAWIEPGDKKTIALIAIIWFMLAAYRTPPTSTDLYALGGYLTGGVIASVVVATVLVLAWKGLQKARMRLPV